MANGKLTPKQEAFALEYLKDGNATQAAIRAGYSSGGAEVTGCRLLRNAKIAELIEAQRKDRAKRLLVSADDVVKELKLLAFSDVGEIVDLDSGLLRRGIHERARRAISAVKIRRVTVGEGDGARTEAHVEFKLWSKTEALRDLARHTGVYPEKGASAGGEEPEFQQEE
jgi:phage terminase small subunit